MKERNINTDDLRHNTYENTNHKIVNDKQDITLMNKLNYPSG